MNTNLFQPKANKFRKSKTSMRSSRNKRRTSAYLDDNDGQGDQDESGLYEIYKRSLGIFLLLCVFWFFF